MIKSFKNNLGVILVVVLALIPVVFWVFIGSLIGRFSSLTQAFRGLGQITGLLGMVLLSINFVLSARFKFLDEWFNGLNRVYIKHHTIGILAFCFLLFHPTFLVVQYLFISLKASFDFLFSTSNFPVILGETALLVFIVLMVITLYLNFKYQNWKNTHKYLGLVLFLGIFHMLLIPSDISNNSFLKYYMLLITSLGALSYLYRTVFKLYKKREYKYRLEEVRKINNNTVELKLKPLNHEMKYMPGQFVFVRFDGGGLLSESHPFSISSGLEKEITLGIKALGDFTSMVYLMKPGATCLVEGPFGVFSFTKATSKRQVWVAGGIGITPFLGMARQAATGGVADYKIDLYYSVKNNTEAAFAEEFVEISKRNSNFKFHQHFSEKDGFISAGVIKNDTDIAGAEVFLCGPQAFMENLRNQFIDLGINNKKIHSEEFNLLN